MHSTHRSHKPIALLGLFLALGAGAFFWFQTKPPQSGASKQQVGVIAPSEDTTQSKNKALAREVPSLPVGAYKAVAGETESPKLQGIPVVSAAPEASVPMPRTLPALKAEAPPKLVEGRKDQPLPGAMQPINPDPPASGPHHMQSTERDLRLQELLAEVAAEKDPHVAQRTKLTIAGYYVGNGDWQAAKTLYEGMAASPYVEVQSAVLRNLDVVNHNLALEAETNDQRREWLKLDLAQLHQRYGHEKTSKTMLRDLEKSAEQEAVRKSAAQRLATYVVPALPTLPQPSQKDAQ